MKTLKGCPFCGSPPKEVFEWNPCTAFVMCINGNCATMPAVEVMAEMIEHRGDTTTFSPKREEAQQEARERWNTRVSDTEELRRAFEAGRMAIRDGSDLVGFIDVPVGAIWIHRNYAAYLLSLKQKEDEG